MKINRKDLLISTVASLQFKISSLISDIDIGTLNDNQLTTIADTYRDLSILIKAINQMEINDEVEFALGEK